MTRSWMERARARRLASPPAGVAGPAEGRGAQAAAASARTRAVSGGRRVGIVGSSRSRVVASGHDDEVEPRWAPDNAPRSETQMWAERRDQAGPPQLDAGPVGFEAAQELPHREDRHPGRKRHEPLIVARDDADAVLEERDDGVLFPTGHGTLDASGEGPVPERIDERAAVPAPPADAYQPVVAQTAFDVTDVRAPHPDVDAHAGGRLRGGRGARVSRLGPDGLSHGEHQHGHEQRAQP